MEFRYREMVYRPNYHDFYNDDREEWYPNGIFNYNVSRLIKDLAAEENSELPFEVKVRLYMDQMKDRADTLPLDDVEELPFD